MINLHNVNEELLQIIGVHKNVKVNGIAHKVSLNSQRKVWHYNLKLHKGSKLVKLISNANEGTMSTKDSLLSRIQKECEKVNLLT